MSKKTYIILYSLGIIASIGIMFLSMLPYDFMVAFIVVGIFGVLMFSYLIYIEVKGYKKTIDYKEDNDEYEAIDLDANPENPNKFYRASIKWVSAKKGGLTQIPSKAITFDFRIANDSIMHKALVSNYYFPLKSQTQSLIRIEEDEELKLIANMPFYIFLDSNVIGVGVVLSEVCNK